MDRYIGVYTIVYYAKVINKYNIYKCRRDGLYLSYWYLWNYILLRFGKLEILFPKIDMMVGDYYENK